jgi:cation diffusion facilitator CzcD-associated flavoprotein CzcO
MSEKQAMSHFDVVIVGAGLSGIGAARHLKTTCPDRSFVLLEGREAIGGTWDLFRYPGIRSDSDMYTLGYAFRPWTGDRAIADGPSILDYVRDTAREEGIEPHIRFGHKVSAAAWSTEDAAWTVTAQSPTGPTTFTCNFLFLCGGYYSYAGGYTPDFAGMDQFGGRIVHPQSWPEDLDYAGKRVVVIGSGATAVTLVPEMARTAGHVTMLQRSPTYIVGRPGQDAFALRLRRALPERLSYGLIRWRNVLMGMLFYRMARRRPEQVRKAIIDQTRQSLGPDFDIETHFSPRYNPWDQRLCLAPDGDFFESLKSGQASVVTDEVETFTGSGLRLKSGAEIEADIVVTATGLKLEALNGIALSVDGEAVRPSETLSYKGMMYSGVPNLASAFGYTNASWTLKCDLTCEYVCRLLNHMRRKGLRQSTPILKGPPQETAPWLDFSSGYVQRSIDLFPRQGTTAPWRLHQNYALDMAALRFARLEDGAMTFTNPVPSARRAA